MGLLARSSGQRVALDNDQSFIWTRPELFPPEEAPLQVKLVLAEAPPVYYCGTAYLPGVQWSKGLCSSAGKQSEHFVSGMHFQRDLNESRKIDRRLWKHYLKRHFQESKRGGVLAKNVNYETIYEFHHLRKY